MNPAKEFVFLQELMFIGEAVEWHAERIRELAGSWLKIRAELREPKRPSKIDFDPSEHGSLARAKIAAANEVTARHQELLNTSISLQGELFIHVEAFLSLFARASLILFPTLTGKHSTKRKRRGESLRIVVGLTSPHAIELRSLRNHWMHFDERIDDLPIEVGVLTTVQRFVLSSEAHHYKNNTVRLFIVDTLTLIYHGTDAFDLEDLFAAVIDVSQRAGAALSTWSQRHASEFT